jgi:uncharacterized glyoxalase superfamily protein PhnB
MDEQSTASPVFTVTVLMAEKIDDLSSFYQKAFGFKSVKKSKNLSGRNVMEIFTYGSSMIVVREEGQFELTEVSPKTSKVPSPVCIVLLCDDVDKMYEIAKVNGAEVIFAPKLTVWGSRMCKLRDPVGYVWYLKKNDPVNNPINIDLPVVQSY